MMFINIYIYTINLYIYVNICIYRFVCIYVWIGKKFLPPPQPKSEDLLEISYPERSHFEERMGKKLPSTHITADWRRKKTIITANAGKEPPNYDIEAIMNRKQRVNSEERKRNDVGVATGNVVGLMMM